MTRFPRPMGSLSRRVNGVERILTREAARARAAAAACDDPNSQHAAALRGKAKAFDEAAALVRRLDRGRPLGGHRWWPPKQERGTGEEGQ